MKFFKNKLNVVLTIVLVILVALGVVLGIKFFSMPAVAAVDFTSMSEAEVVSWAKENGVEELIEFEHEYDEEIQEGRVIYQSVKEGDEITDKVLIIISDGPDQSNMIEIPVDTLNTKESFELWAKDKGLTNISYIDTKNPEKEEGTIISIEPSKVKKDDLVTVTFVSNKNIEVPDFSYMSDDEIKAWSDENGIKVTYTKKSSKLEKGSFVEQSVKAGDKVAKGDSITIYVSTGVSDEKSAYIDPTKYLGVKEEEFLKELKELGFKNVVKLEEIESKQPYGTICYYLPDGTQSFETKIEYKVSKDPNATEETAYIDETKYLGVKEEDFLKELKELGFTNVVKIEEIKSSRPAGTICYYLPDGKQSKDTKIEYKVSKDENAGTKTAYIHETKYLGVKEEDFVNDLKKLGFSNVVKIGEVTNSKYSDGTICYYLPDGNQKLDGKIEYKVSKKSGENQSNTGYIHETKYLGVKEEDFVNELKSLGYTNVVKVDSVYSDTRAAGTICYYLPDGNQKFDTKIEYKVSLGKKQSSQEKPSTPEPEKEAEIMSFGKIEDPFSKDTFNDTKDALYEYLVTNSGFKNVTFNGVSADFSIGHIISISVNGNKNYTAGKYKVSTPIVVEICNNDTSNN